MYIPFLYHTKMIYHKNKKEGGRLTQAEVREKLIEKSKGLKIKFIAEETGIPREIISKFKNSKRDLYPESLEVLNNYLENH